MQDLVIYQSEDGKLRLDIKIERETVWLTQAQIAELFGKGRSTITEHIKNIYDEGELQPSETSMKTSNVGKTDITTFKPTALYNLDMMRWKEE